MIQRSLGQTVLAGLVNKELTQHSGRPIRFDCRLLTGKNHLRYEFGLVFPRNN